MIRYPTQAELLKLFYYKDGDLYWKSDRGCNIKANDLVGGISKSGYKRTKINGVQYFCHRLIYIYFNGEISDGLFIDHIDNDPLNNNIENLRLCTPSENSQNRGLSSRNRSGIKGVHFESKYNKWRAGCRVEGKYYNLGRFVDIREAEKVIKDFREQFHGVFSNHG